jgi:hypothetical protein
MATVTIHSPNELMKTFICASAFNQLPFQKKHIDLEETMSCFTDSIIMRHLGWIRVFSALTNTVPEALKDCGKQSVHQIKEDSRIWKQNS